MTLAIGTAPPSDSRRSGGFTLIELILVMAIIVIAVAMIMPKLSGFFAARSVDNEAKRVLALMHYGQQRAVSEGTPMMLWIDSARGEYGLEREPGYGNNDPHEIEEKLDVGLKINTIKMATKQPIANSQTGRILAGQAVQGKNKLPAIYFSPDGAINDSMSVSGISIQDANDPPVWIAPSNSQLSYAIQSQNPAATIRR
jgi:prepilin-type N-terminal cleavage/methylation domain-containing protein